MSNNSNQFSEDGQEISTIKPDLGTQQQERQKPRFTYSTAEYDSYIKNGKHKELTKQLVTRMNSDDGRVQAYYVKGPIREVHTIPFTKKKVDDILYGKHPLPYKI